MYGATGLACMVSISSAKGINPCSLILCTALDLIKDEMNLQDRTCIKMKVDSTKALLELK